MNLIGQHEVTVGDKGRIALPKKIRSGLGDEVIVTYGFEKTLIVVAEKDWGGLISNLKDSSLFEMSARDVKRFLLGSATQVELDKQGRFILPTYLREHAEIKDDVVFLGLSTYAELWDKGRWLEHVQKLEGGIGDIAESLIRNIE